MKSYDLHISVNTETGNFGVSMDGLYNVTAATMAIRWRRRCSTRCTAASRNCASASTPATASAVRNAPTMASGSSRSAHGLQPNHMSSCDACDRNSVMERPRARSRRVYADLVSHASQHPRESHPA